MSIMPHKVGTTLTDSFFFLDRTTRAAVTGKVNADFSIDISKNGVGNQATTGCTITEVDAVNNPGEYKFVASISGFPAATGYYTVRIIYTADVVYTYDISYLVTENGDFDGTFGAAAFTATASNGRVMVGLSALAGATVYIRTPAGVLYTTTTTDANGLWGPVFLDANGTWTGYATKSGYSTVSFTISVAALVATGPGTDVTLTATSSGSGLTLGELMSYGRRQIRDSNGPKADTELKSAINDALCMISRSRYWPWYETVAALRLRTSYNTGTVSVSQDGTTVVLAGGTWPTWVDSSCQIRLGAQWYKIASRTNGTDIVITQPYGEAAIVASASWILFKADYTLASDLIKFGSITMPGPGWVWGGNQASYEEVLKAQNAYIGGQKFPAIWSIHKNMWCAWPFPNQDATLNYMYYRSPAALVSTTDEADIDPMHLDVIQRAVDYQLALRYGNVVSGGQAETMAAFKGALATAEKMDKAPVPRGSILASPGNPMIPARLIGSAL